MTGAVPAGELLGCPFCGCAVDIVERECRDEFMGMRTWYYVEGKHVGGVCPGQVRARGSRETAIAAWNTRVPATPSPQPVAEVERVEIVAKAMYDATHAGLANCYAWDDEWEPHQEMGRARYMREAAAAIDALSALGGRA